MTRQKPHSTPLPPSSHSPATPTGGLSLSVTVTIHSRNRAGMNCAFVVVVVVATVADEVAAAVVVAVSLPLCRESQIVLSAAQNL